MANEEKTTNQNWLAVAGVVAVAVLVWGGYEIHKITVGPVTFEFSPGKPETPANQPEPQQPVAPPDALQSEPGAFWLEQLNTWYGPFGQYEGMCLLYSSAGGFSVWDPLAVNASGSNGVIIPYPDPNKEYPRNQWIPLLQSRFSVFIDSEGKVFGVFR